MRLLAWVVAMIVGLNVAYVLLLLAVIRLKQPRVGQAARRSPESFFVGHWRRDGYSGEPVLSETLLAVFLERLKRSGHVVVTRHGSAPPWFRRHDAAHFAEERRPALRRPPIAGESLFYGAPRSRRWPPGPRAA